MPGSGHVWQMPSSQSARRAAPQSLTPGRMLISWPYEPGKLFRGGLFLLVTVQAFTGPDEQPAGLGSTLRVTAMFLHLDPQRPSAPRLGPWPAAQRRFASPDNRNARVPRCSPNKETTSWQLGRGNPPQRAFRQMLQASCRPPQPEQLFVLHLASRPFAYLLHDPTRPGAYALATAKPLPIWAGRTSWKASRSGLSMKVSQDQGWHNEKWRSPQSRCQARQPREHGFCKNACILRCSCATAGGKSSRRQRPATLPSACLSTIPKYTKLLRAAKEATTFETNHPFLGAWSR